MHLWIKGRDPHLNDAVRAFLEDRVIIKLSRVSKMVQSIAISIRDVNGPRGGIDHVIRIIVRLTSVGTIVVRHRAPDTYAGAPVAIERDRPSSEARAGAPTMYPQTGISTRPRCAVAVVTELIMKNLNTILHPTDFSENAQHARKLACDLARDHGARLIVLHVAPPLPAQWTGHGLSLLHPQAHWWDAEDQLRLVSCEDFQPELLLRSGEPGPIIVNVAKETNADLIVIGQPQPNRWRWLIEERVAQSVARTAPCPVLVATSPTARSTQLRNRAASHAKANPGHGIGTSSDERWWRN